MRIIIIIIIGEIPSLATEQAEQLITKYGGKLHNIIDSQTDVIILGYLSVFTDAKNRGIQITDQEGFYKFIDDSHPNKYVEIPIIKNYIENRSDLQSKIIKYLDDIENSEENFQILLQTLENQKISESKYNLTDLFHLITRIANNHYRFPGFFDKIERVLIIFKNEIKKYYLNSEIFNIFKSNKRILLFLLKEKLIIMDKYIVNKISKGKYLIAKYHEYFKPEIELFNNNKFSELQENFYENREIGEKIWL